MTSQPISVLHVEDSRLTRAVVRGLLQKVCDQIREFRIAESEEAALASFQEHPPDLVILDYQLSEGDGLSCLKRMRKLDTVVPILAISGTATPLIAAELLEGGADDFLDKTQLNHDTLGQSVLAALHRASVWRSRGRSQETLDRLRETGRRLMERISDEKSQSLLAGIKELDDILRGTGIDQEQIKELAEGSAFDVLPEHDSRRALVRGVWAFVQANGPAAVSPREEVASNEHS
jgi:CheY-like chemotaxis protein